MGPGQYPQYTRADFGQEAVGSSLHRDHRTTATRQTTSPTIFRTLKSRTVAEPWLQTHGEEEHNPRPEVVSRPQKLSAPQSQCERERYVLGGAP